MILRAIRGERPIPRTLVVMAVLLLVGTLFALGVRPAYAATTFVVDSGGDGQDANLADGNCSTGVECTLRAAIQQANATAGADTINFAIPDSIGGVGVKTIAPVATLPAITEQVEINGYSQPGTSPNTKAVGNDAVLEVELSGANTGANVNGLSITGGTGSVVEGLVINNFGENGILIDNGAKDTIVQGNFIGTDPSGTIGR